MEQIMRDVPFTVRIGAAELSAGQWKRDGLVYTNESRRLTVTVGLTTYEGTGAVRQINTITNNGNRTVRLTGFSSAFVNTAHGKVMLSQNRWQTEGQWKTFDMEELGLIQTTVHPWEKGVFRIESVGSWATGGHFPLTMVLCDDGRTIYMEIEGAHNWMLEHSCSGSIRSIFYTLEGTAAHEENGGWYYDLKPGESYTAQPAVWGVVEGGFEEAAGELAVYRRLTSLTRFADDTIPVVFNDYMNCLWGQPSDKKLLPLIDAAAKVGCEVFCIDAGWHKNAAPGGALGDWIVNNEKFGERGLAGVFSCMKEKGLKPGVWFELESVTPNAAAYGLDGDCLLKRYGEVIPRAFFNFRNEKVRAHLKARIDELYGMGVRYIKNDYNATTGIGCDPANGGAPAEGLIENYEAFVSFIDEVCASHPDLVIENCGSGACRSEHGTLKHFFLQSTSDQEFYYWNPSIIAGTMAQMEPEKAGVWSYPMPVYYDEQKSFTADDAWRAQFADGEQTIFNMVNGMCGVLYQSGRLDLADEYNLSLVAEGVAAYKKMRRDIVKAKPILPGGPFGITEKGIFTAGLSVGERAYLAVWRIGGEADRAEIDLAKYGFTKASAWYPSRTELSFDGRTLRVELPKKKEYTARMILLEK